MRCLAVWLCCTYILLGILHYTNARLFEMPTVQGANRPRHKDVRDQKTYRLQSNFFKMMAGLPTRMGRRFY